MGKYTRENIITCPFCRNSRSWYFGIVSPQKDWYQVHCQKCGAKGPVGYTVDESIELWNLGSVNNKK